MDKKLSERDMKEYWRVIIDIVHEMETANAMKGEAAVNPNFKPLEQFAQKQLVSTVMTPIKSLAQIREALQYGGMRD